MHKMTLTGVPISGLKGSSDGQFFRFNMEETGSPSAPKGLPKSSKILYTIFVSPKQLKKAGITKQNIHHYKLFVQGEPALDVPLDECPGEIGIVCYQIQIVPGQVEFVPPIEPDDVINEPKSEIRVIRGKHIDEQGNLDRHVYHWLLPDNLEANTGDIALVETKDGDQIVSVRSVVEWEKEKLENFEKNIARLKNESEPVPMKKVIAVQPKPQVAKAKKKKSN